MENAFDFQSGWMFVIVFLTSGMYEEPKESQNWMLGFFFLSLQKNLKVRVS